ncbi:DUF1643 domain-containing protein [Duganella sp. LjRoot269]|uniref:DUF1643 domain-containing protein n=1 Tax=Duganella sp. LjRoot269 TaxID=3342305 RepID=UPI003ED08676
MKSLLGGEIYSYDLDGWCVEWESTTDYRHWCQQSKTGFEENLLVVMFNPGSLNSDGRNLRRDTTLRILREVCEPISVNIFVVNLFDFASPAPDELFANWPKRDSHELVFAKLRSMKFSAIIRAYGDYENRGERDAEIKERISFVNSIFSNLKEIALPKNSSGTPKHPMIWQRQMLKPEISALLAQGMGLK